MTQKITPMNCKTVLKHLENGAQLRSRWSYGQRLNSLYLASGETLYIQYSNISALIKAGKLRSISMSGDNYNYYLVNPIVEITDANTWIIPGKAKVL